ncbi:MAG: hypothetical protein GTN59_07655 [Candidatus Dadabacteria bacterium]|jgi:hypothetical protein|nr:hypothetical protein [Candidatus Dadabacteria bacterium]
MNLKKIWEARNQILEGIKNNTFKSEAVEIIAEERNKMCVQCNFYDTQGHHCYIPGTQPCCGSCGCSLKLKQRSLSSDCPEGYWEPVLTEDEDIKHDNLNPNEDA